ncbi:MAG: PPC domain-containing DNA-binding protein [Erysipelotrichaceae bacterium]
MIKVIRLAENADVKKELKALNITSGCIISAVGCLKHLHIRLAEADNEYNQAIKVEVLSLSGTISSDGLHLHIGTIDKEFNCYGGHLLDGSIVDTTLEIVIMIFNDIELTRLYDKNTGYKELKIKSFSAL